MRIFLVFVIILNLLYAGWEYLSPAVITSNITPLADNLQTLELLRESGSHKDVISYEGGDEQRAELVDEQQDISEGVQLAKAKTVRSCYTLGPFKDKDIMQQVRVSLSEHVTGMSVRKLSDSEKHRYWVYIPPLKNRRQAKRMVNKLRESNVKDFYIILNGDTRNGVSLGHFKEQLHANRRLKKVTRLGYNAEIKVIYREFDVYWLDYQNNEPQSEVGFSVAEYVTEGVSELSRDCE